MSQQSAEVRASLMQLVDQIVSIKSSKDGAVLITVQNGEENKVTVQCTTSNLTNQEYFMAYDAFTEGVIQKLNAADERQRLEMIAQLISTTLGNLQNTIQAALQPRGNHECR